MLTIITMIMISTFPIVLLNPMNYHYICHDSEKSCPDMDRMDRCVGSRAAALQRCGAAEQRAAGDAKSAGRAASAAQQARIGCHFLVSDLFWFKP